MIDYTKLKKVHELAKKSNIHVMIVIHAWDEGEPDTVNISIAKYGFINDIDEALVKLKELAKPHPKYKPGDIVWHLGDDNDIQSLYIKRVELEDLVLMYLEEGGGWREEKDLYPSREALIEAQIDYWRNMLGEELEQHISPYCEPKSCTQNPETSTRDDGQVEETRECEHDFIPFPGALALSNCKKCGKSVFPDECGISTECPKCHATRVYDGRCWVIGCDYKECEHESDGEVYTDAISDVAIRGIKFKCIKCGEFYR